MDWLTTGIVVGVAGAVGAIAVGTITKGRMGINFGARTCPQCGTTMPMFRKPASLRQALWGGNSCANCGCETDKWARRISPR